MTPLHQTLCSFWLGSLPLASAAEDIAGVLPVEAMVTAGPGYRRGFLGTVPSPDHGGEGGDLDRDALPVVDGCVVMGVLGAPPPNYVLLLHPLSIAVAVTRMGELLTTGMYVERSLPEWLARHTGTVGVETVVEAEGLWFVIGWRQKVTRDLLTRWHEGANGCQQYH
jgi:hypothetical protein